jgi:hypothetical protein
VCVCVCVCVCWQNLPLNTMHLTLQALKCHSVGTTARGNIACFTHLTEYRGRVGSTSI